MRLYLIAGGIACALLSSVPARSQAPSNSDQIGETLKAFYKNHKKCKCFRRAIEGFDDQKFKVAESPWVDCSLGQDATFGGQKLLSEVDPTRPFGFLASFYKTRLVEITYTLALQSVATLLPALEQRYGKPISISRDADGVKSARWSSREALLNAELVTISPAVAEKDFLRIGKGQTVGAVQVTIQSNRVEMGSPDD